MKIPFFSKGCALFFAVSAVIILLVLAIIYFSSEPRKEPSFVRDVEKKITEEEANLRNKDSENYDIEATVSALYSIEKALKESAGFEELSSFIVGRHTEFVAPEVILLKHKFFLSFKNLIDTKNQIDEMNSVYKVSSSIMLDLLSVTGGSFTSIFNNNKEQAKKVWQERIVNAKIKSSFKKRLNENSSEVIKILFDYSNICSKYFREWDKLCASRDRAYLAFYERDWEEMSKSARSARNIFKNDEESAILLSVALSEHKGELEDAEALTVIEELVKSSNGQSAPAYLLRGIHHFKNGDFDKAMIDFDQAAAYYPKQGEHTDDRLNLYKKREFLNRSKEGRLIINSYRGIMTGAGYFSPDFQKARVLLAKGEKDKARQKIFDHFFRRRLQNQWDKVLNDFLFCRDFLGTDLREILLNDKYKIRIEPSWISSNPAILLINNDEKSLHNATLLACVRFTDMMKGDYLSFPVANSVAQIPSGQSITFGGINISYITKQNLGTEKKWKDAVEYGAILISDELITWVTPEPVGENPNDHDTDKTGAVKDFINNAVEKIMEKTKK